MNTSFEAFEKKIKNPLNYLFFMLTKLPMGFISGLKIVALTPQISSISVKYKWVNQNPFNSIYFAVLGMAAELSTGLLAFGQIHNRTPGVSMLVIKNEAQFFKKAVGKIVFTCTNGQEVMKAVEETILTKQGTTIVSESIGKNEAGEVVATFLFTWSFKAKN